MHDHLHQSHAEIVKRLNRASGHVKSIVDMIQAGRPCPDIAQQLHAVEKAICQAKRTLIQDHIDKCLEDALGPRSKAQRQRLEEFRRIAKYL